MGYLQWMTLPLACHRWISNCLQQLVSACTALVGCFDVDCVPWRYLCLHPVGYLDVGYLDVVTWMWPGFRKADMNFT